jgi:rhodanese-related sulfurtransferase
MFGFGVKTITTDQLADELNAGKPILLDVREPYEFAEGHVPGARNVPLETLASAAEKLDPAARTLIICRSGHRSATAAKALKRGGFTDVHSVKGGTLAWRGKLQR